MKTKYQKDQNDKIEGAYVIWKKVEGWQTTMTDGWLTIRQWTISSADFVSSGAKKKVSSRILSKSNQVRCMNEGIWLPRFEVTGWVVFTLPCRQVKIFTALLVVWPWPTVPNMATKNFHGRYLKNRSPSYTGCHKYWVHFFCRNMCDKQTKQVDFFHDLMYCYT